MTDQPYIDPTTLAGRLMHDKGAEDRPAGFDAAKALEALQRVPDAPVDPRIETPPALFTLDWWTAKAKRRCRAEILKRYSESDQINATLDGDTETMLSIMGHRDACRDAFEAHKVALVTFMDGHETREGYDLNAGWPG